MRWLVDFHAAEDVGMAIRVPLTVDDMTFGFDTLVVTGLRATPEPADEAGALAALLDAHRYTEGLAVTPVGTPTNNSDSGPSGHAARLDPARTYPLPGTGEIGDGAAALASALGIAAATVAAIPGAGAAADGGAEAMQTLLWPATGGYFLEHLFAVLPEAPAARAHALAHVRPEGPLPMLRIGRQPYGVLPVSSLDHWPVLPADSGPIDFPRPKVELTVLQGLRQRWRAAATQVPRIDRRPGGQAPTEATILAVMRGAPTSDAYDMRLVFDDAAVRRARAAQPDPAPAPGRSSGWRPRRASCAASASSATRAWCRP